MGGGFALYHSTARGGSQTHATNHDARRTRTEQRQPVRGPEKKRKGPGLSRDRHHNLGCAFTRKQCRKLPAEGRERKVGRCCAFFPCSAEQVLKFYPCNDSRQARSSSCINQHSAAGQRGSRAPPKNSRRIGFGLVFGVRNDGHLPKRGG